METRLEHCAGAVLAHGDGPALLVNRLRAGCYEVPKGHLEVCESPQQAALRELREETGLLSPAHIGELLGKVSYSFTKDSAAIYKQVDYYLCFSDLVPRFGKLPRGTKELRWIEVPEIAGLSLVSEDLRTILLRAAELVRRPA